jgi:RimJ/RimL family protein N-acetyltransferase
MSNFVGIKTINELLKYAGEKAKPEEVTFHKMTSKEEIQDAIEKSKENLEVPIKITPPWEWSEYKDYAYYLIKWKGEPVGFFGNVELEDNGEIINVPSAGFFEEYRRYGLGTIIYKKMIHSGNEIFANKLFDLLIEPQNIASVGLLEHMNKKEEGVIKENDPIEDSGLTYRSWSLQNTPKEEQYE